MNHFEKFESIALTMKNYIDKSSKVLLFPHVNMDGDAVGSCTALCLALRKIGKECFVYSEADIPKYVNFLGKGCFTKEIPYTPDLAIMVDCGVYSRIEPRDDFFKSIPNCFCLDHHEGQSEIPCVIRDSSAAACGVLVYEFIKFLNYEIDKDIATALYTAIVSDTGCFKFSNTDARAFNSVAELLPYGVDHSGLLSRMYENKPFAQLQMESLAIERSKIFAGGKAIISYVTPDDLLRWNAKREDCETCIDQLRTVEGVEIACFLKPDGDVFKGSLRAKTFANVSGIAEKFGGGGHHKAAGCTMTGMTFEEAYSILKAEIERTLNC